MTRLVDHYGSEVRVMIERSLGSKQFVEHQLFWSLVVDSPLALFNPDFLVSPRRWNSHPVKRWILHTGVIAPISVEQLTVEKSLFRCLAFLLAEGYARIGYSGPSIQPILDVSEQHVLRLAKEALHWGPQSTPYTPISKPWPYTRPTSTPRAHSPATIQGSVAAKSTQAIGQIEVQDPAIPCTPPVGDDNSISVQAPNEHKSVSDNQARPVALVDSGEDLGSDLTDDEPGVEAVPQSGKLGDDVGNQDEDDQDAVPQEVPRLDDDIGDKNESDRENKDDEESNQDDQDIEADDGGSRPVLEEPEVRLAVRLVRLAVSG